MLTALSYCWEFFLAVELNLIIFLQEKLQPIEPFLSIVTEWCGPYGIEKFFIPLVGALNVEVMIELFTVTSSMNLITDVIKLIFQFSRPFWWVNETTFYSKLARPKLRQSIFTCETSSGFPSGHSSLFTALLLLERKYVKFILRKITNWSSKTIEFIIDIGLSVLLGLMWTTRLYFGCHFLHQCIFGSLIAAIFVGYSTRFKDQIINANKMKGITVTVVCGAFIGSIYLSMKALDMDPQHSIRMAFKWCEDPNYLSPETTVMVSICGNLGTLLGFALTLPSRSKVQQKLDPVTSIPMTIALIILKHLMQDYTPRYKGRFVFLAWKLMTNLIFSFMMFWVVTKYTKKDNQKKKIK